MFFLPERGECPTATSLPERQEDYDNMENRQSAHKPTHSNLFLYGYALGEFGFTFFLFFVSYYLMLFMTDVLQLPTTLAAVLYTTVQWFEAITMILSGIYIDRAKPRNGKFRPWLVIGSIILLVGMTLFYTAVDLPNWAKGVWFTLFYLIAYIGYNLMWVAYRTLLGPLSRNPQDTISLTSAASQMGSVAGLCYSFIGVRLLHGFSSERMGFTMTAFIFGCLIVLCMFIVSRITEPFDNARLYAKGEVQQATTPKEMLGVFSKPMCAFFLAVTFREAASTILPTLMAYYFSYVMGNPTLMSTYLTVITLSGLVGHFFARKLANTFGKKKMFICASLLSCVCIISTRFVGTSAVGFMVLMGFNAFFAIFSGAMIPAFITEIADYNEYTKGVHARAFTSSVGGTALRFAQIVGGGLASFGLAAIGYQTGAEVTPGIISGITNLMTFGSAIVIVVSVVFISMYKIDRATMEKIYAQRNAQLEAEAEA